MTTTQSPTALPTQTQVASADPSAVPSADPSADPRGDSDKLHPSIDVISQLIAAGLAKSFAALREKLTETIAESGEHYLADAIDQMKDSAGKLVQWSKKNPVQTAVAVAAVLAVSAFLISTMKSKTAEFASKTDDQATPPSNDVSHTSS